MRRRALYASLLLGLLPGTAAAGAQRYEQLSASVQSLLQSAVTDQAPPQLNLGSPAQSPAWVEQMSTRLAKRILNPATRRDFLVSLQYEATRAGLDPELVLAVVEVESHFRKYAVSPSGARGYMQVMPFWVSVIGNGHQNLFSLRTNLRFGCVILRHYLDQENGDLHRALARYNGSLGRDGYPDRVVRAWRTRFQDSPAQPPGQQARSRQAGPQEPRPMSYMSDD